MVDNRFSSKRSEGLSWPSWFLARGETSLRRHAHCRLTEIVRRFEGTAFATRAARAVEALDAPGLPPTTSPKRASAADGPLAPGGGADWIAQTLDVAAAGLDEHPPHADNWEIRKAALMLLDFPLNVRPRELWRRPVGRFYQRFMTRAIDEIAADGPEQGLQIWKMYNMGFVVRSANHAVGFDIHPGWRLEEPLSSGQMERLAGLLDVAFVSHLHWDHLHKGFLEMMLAAGKTVVLPPGLLPRLDHRRVLRVYNDYRHPTRIGDIEVRTYPGWQNFWSRNCVYLVRMDGLTIAHNGDNTRQRIYPRLARRDDVDVLLANGRTRIRRLADEAEPEMLITGHENELAHFVPIRSTFRQTFRRLKRLGLGPASPTGIDCHVLTWGESLHYLPDRARGE